MFLTKMLAAWGGALRQNIIILMLLARSRQKTIHNSIFSIFFVKYALVGEKKQTQDKTPARGGEQKVIFWY